AGWSSTRLLLGCKDDLIPMKALVKLCRLLAPVAKRIHLGFGQVLYPYKVVLACADADQFVKLGLDRRPVAILRILDQEHHQEGDDGCARVDDELPSVGEAENRSADPPDHHDQDTA